MIPHWKFLLLGGAALLAASAPAFAQDAPPPPRQRPPAAMRPDPQTLPAYQGKVLQFTLTPRGDIDGLILGDGTEVKTPPHLGAVLAATIKPGDSVTIHGLKAASMPVVQAMSIKNETSGQVVTDNGPPGAGRGPGARRATEETQGKVKLVLHGPRGDVNGALLEDGTMLRLPAPEAERFSALLQPGQTIIAEGITVATPLGKVLDLRQIGATRETLTQIRRGPAPPSPKPDRMDDHRRPPRPPRAPE